MMMSKTPHLWLGVLLALPLGSLWGQESYSEVVGYVKTTLTANSDSIIAPQLLRASELTATVTSVSSAGAGQASLNLSGVSLAANQFQFNASTQPNTYFVLVTSGNLSGTYFLISSNTASSIVVNLDGLTVTGPDVTAIEVRPCWTLATLFPASDANVSFVPSASAGGNTRRTTLILPNTAGSGINRAASATYFFNNTAGIQDWVSTTNSSTKVGHTAILPGTFLIHRNTGGTPATLTLTHSGSILVHPLTHYIGTLSNGPTDNYLALPRATDYTLSQLGLTDASFTQSTSTGGNGRRDTLLVINAGGSGVNRAASATYFRFQTNWYSTAAPTVITNNAVIPAGAALIVRKVTGDGNDRIWVNTNNISLAN